MSVNLDIPLTIRHSLFPQRQALLVGGINNEPVFLYEGKYILSLNELELSLISTKVPYKLRKFTKVSELFMTFKHNTGKIIDFPLNVFFKQCKHTLTTSSIKITKFKSKWIETLFRSGASKRKRHQHTIESIKNPILYGLQITRKKISEFTECSICCVNEGEAIELKHATLDCGKNIFLPCRNHDHVMCVSCFRQWMLNFSSHPINANCSTIHCPSECDMDTIFGYTLCDIKHLFTDQEYTKIKNHRNKFPFSGVIAVNHMSCGKTMLVPRDKLTNQPPGSCIINCTHCDQKFCYHCLDDCDASQTNSIICISCYENDDDEDPYNPLNLGRFNRFFRNPNPNAHEEYLLRNWAITPKLAAEQILDAMVSPIDNVNFKCHAPGCGIKMCRTSACNELSHCSLKRCDVCGYMGLRTETVLLDHFFNNLDECPRYYEDGMWHEKLKNLGYRCEDGICYDHYHACNNPEHRCGKNALFQIRKARIVESLIHNIPSHIYSETIKLVQKMAVKKGVVYEFNLYISEFLSDVEEEEEESKQIKSNPIVFSCTI